MPKALILNSKMDFVHPLTPNNPNLPNLVRLRKEKPRKSHDHSLKIPQENPTPWNFEHNEPVKRATRYPGFNSPALDDQGRAICRIVHAHGWSIIDIAGIFNLPQRRISKAVNNKYSPPANILEDYAMAGKDFEAKFPPINKIESITIDNDELNAHQAANPPCPVTEASAEIPIPICLSASISAQSGEGSDSTGKSAGVFRPAPSRRVYHRGQASFSPHSGVPRIVITPPEETVARLDFLIDFLHGLHLSKLHPLFIEGGFQDGTGLPAMGRMDVGMLTDTMVRILGSAQKSLGRTEVVTGEEVAKLILAIRNLDA
ncbi:hypothetical protein MVEN_01604500 [Mycena venus]|uniref:Uncharacterized protein n=1 Tax=Mycena venus TaxID=2733690 RepID=A0A8H6XT43_9AGAR|nr:hypothetical protein MVEN_01604500 [Mycena venus]